MNECIDVPWAEDIISVLEILWTYLELTDSDNITVHIMITAVWDQTFRHVGMVCPTAARGCNSHICALELTQYCHLDTVRSRLLVWEIKKPRQFILIETFSLTLLFNTSHLQGTTLEGIKLSYFICHPISCHWDCRYVFYHMAVLLFSVI